MVIFIFFVPSLVLKSILNWESQYLMSIIMDNIKQSFDNCRSFLVHSSMEVHRLIPTPAKIYKPIEIKHGSYTWHHGGDL